MAQHRAKLRVHHHSKTRFQPMRTRAGASLFGGAAITHSHTVDYWSDIIRALRAKTRCEKCGFVLEVDREVRGRWKVDPMLWAERCKERAHAEHSPFDCPHLKAATTRSARRDNLV